MFLRPGTPLDLSLLQYICDLLPIGIGVTNREGTILFANKTLLDLGGYSPQDVQKFEQAANLYAHVGDRARILAQLKKQGYVDRLAVEFKAKDGSVLSALISLRQVKYGAITGWLALVENTSLPQDQKDHLETTVKDLEQTRSAMLNLLEDINEEKKRSQEAAHDLKKFQLAVENAADHIVITDPEGTVLYANPAATIITGFSQKEILGRKSGSKKLWGGQMDHAFYAKLWETIKIKKRAFFGEAINRRKNKELYNAKVTISPVLDEQNQVRYFVGIERDITREKQIEQMKTEFVSYASHQLRTPLGSMRWNMEMLLTGDFGKLPTTAREAIKHNYISTLRLIGLVNDLLNITRIEEGSVVDHPRLTNLVEVVETVIADLAPEAKDKQVTVSFAKSTDFLPKIMIDRERLHEVVENLLANAIKYNRRGGTVEVLITRQSHSVKLVVKDTGVGIPKTDQANICGKFFRAKNATIADTEGTGLGLFVTKAYTEGWGGTITFVSQEDKGTTFTVNLPLKPKEGRLSQHQKPW